MSEQVPHPDCPVCTAEQEPQVEQPKAVGFVSAHGLKCLAEGHHIHVEPKAQDSDAFKPEWRYVVPLYTAPPKPTDRVRGPLQNLVNALDACESSITNAFYMQQIHGRTHNGPTYGVELKAARTALATTEE